MQVFHTAHDLQAFLTKQNQSQGVAFVPTMGNLHSGHLALVKYAKTLSPLVVVSIFVNRLQFAPHEDFDAYPRTLQRDCELLASLGCTAVYAPNETELYPHPQRFKIHPDPELADILEGQFRPGFFVGVCTVVMKLFSMVFGKISGEKHAIFGLKDFQQQRIIKQMIDDFNLPIQLHALPTERAQDGLALSSRNGYLSDEQRTQATQLSQTLATLVDAIQARQKITTRWAMDVPHLEQKATQALQNQGWMVDYVTVRRQHDLQSPTETDQKGLYVALAAAKIGGTRLIDNRLF